MSEAPKFTAGPWVVGPVDDTVVTHVGADGVRYEVAAIDGDYNDPDTWPVMEANARLISAAPEMLSALVDAEYALTALAETFEYDEDDAAEMACAFEMLCGETVCQECGCIRDKRDACRAAISKASGTQT